MNHSNQERLFPPGLMREIRDRFWYVDEDPVTGPRVWLESASGSLRLKSVVETLAETTRFPDQLGRANASSRRAGELVAKGLEDVRLFLGARRGVIAPAMSSTHAVFRVVNAILGAAPAPGNVVTTDLEHPCVYDSTHRFAVAYGHQWRVAHVDPKSGFVPVDAVLEKIDKDTLLVGLIHGSNITGAVMDVGRVVSEARRINPGVLVLVDGVQYAPHAPVDVERLDVDAYIFGPYKAFGVKGIGFAYLSERAARLEHWRLAGNPLSSWSLGSAEDPSYAAWSSVVDYLDWLGSHFTTSFDRRTRIVAAMQASDAHLRALLRRLLEGSDELPGLLRMEHVRVHAAGSGDTRDRLCLALMNLAGISSSQAVAFYDQRRIRVHNRTSDAYSKHCLDALGVAEGVRPSACHYNSTEDIDAFLAATAEAGKLSAGEVAELARAVGAKGPGEG